MILRNRYEEEGSYKIKYEENFRMELVRSRKISILYNTEIDADYILKNMVRLNIKQHKNKIGFSISFFIPSEFGNIRSEYEVGNRNKLYSQTFFERGFRKLGKPLDKFFDILDSGIDSIVSVYGPGTDEVRNYIHFVGLLDRVVYDIIKSIPNIISNFYK